MGQDLNEDINNNKALKLMEETRERPPLWLAAIKVLLRRVDRLKFSVEEKRRKWEIFLFLRRRSKARIKGCKRRI